MSQVDDDEVQIYQLLIHLDASKVTNELMERIEETVCPCGLTSEEVDPECAMLGMSGGITQTLPIDLEGIDPRAVETARELLWNVADWRDLEPDFVDAVADALVSALRPWLAPDTSTKRHGEGSPWRNQQGSSPPRSPRENRP